MACFRVHSSVAAIASGLGASTLVVIQAVDLQLGLLLWTLGLLGGILPDIDSNTSKPVNWLFNVLGVGAATMALAWSHARFPLWGVWLSMVLAFVFVRPILMTTFFRLTVHRGVFHSLLAAVFCGIITTLLCAHLLALAALTSWLAGIFVTCGFIVHLLLDEFYAVDFNGLALKSSFGTAIKPLSLRNWPGSLAMIVLCVLAWQKMPEHHGIMRLVGKLPLVSATQNFQVEEKAHLFR